jgi:L-ascorbate metabolism protein UlaG (beta-lactamase superfamily)
MTRLTFLLALSSMCFLFGLSRGAAFERDVFPTPQGDLKIAFIGHASLLFEFAGKTVYVDPVSNLADYSDFPKADLILITHEHYDHLDPKAIALLRTDNTDIVLTESCAGKVEGGASVKNGQTVVKKGFRIEAVPAYNVVHMRSPGQPFHPKGRGNGYILTFGDKRVYVAGDTEDIPEMKETKSIDIAFLPMNLPYTMSPEMVARAARVIRPAILYPYHYGDTDPAVLVKLLKDEPEIEVRVRQMR